MRYQLVTAVLAVSLALTGCAADNSKGRFRVGSAYEIKGKTYYPEESYTKEQTGIASWYGPGFHGKKTANGERFDQNALTAAHPTLQMPSLVRVTNLENGKSLVVRVNDRGPFHSNRIMDLSKRAANELGVIATGTANVRLQVLGPESQALAKAAKQGVDTRGAEIAMNDRGTLDERFAAFYPNTVAMPADPMMIAADGYQPGLPSGAIVEAQTLSVPQAPVITMAHETTIESVIAAETAPIPLPMPAPAQKLPPQHKAAIFQMAPIPEANAGEISARPALALADTAPPSNYMPSKPKFLGMRPVVDNNGR